VILTSSIEPIDVARCYLHGANSFVRKPNDFDRFVELVRQTVSYWLEVNESPTTVGDD